MIFWNIIDTERCAKRAMEILKIDEVVDNTDQNVAIKAASKHITNLRLTVLRIAKHHLTSLVGNCSMGGNKSM